MSSTSIKTTIDPAHLNKTRKSPEQTISGCGEARPPAYLSPVLQHAPSICGRYAIRGCIRASTIVVADFLDKFPHDLHADTITLIATSVVWLSSVKASRVVVAHGHNSNRTRRHFISSRVLPHRRLALPIAYFLPTPTRRISVVPHGRSKRDATEMYRGPEDGLLTGVFPALRMIYPEAKER